MVRLWLIALPALACVAEWTNVAGADEAESELTRFEKPVDEAIDRALAYLAKQQKHDGSFKGAGGDDLSVPALCVMSFLAKGYTPGTGPYGDVLNRSIDYVLAGQRENGFLANGMGRMYSHGICTLMLSEVSGMVDADRQEKIDEALAEALHLTLAAQRIDKPELHQGGWRYQPNSRDSDISCSGWQLMSLRSARNAGAAIPGESIREAVEYILRLRGKDGGFGYQRPSQSGFARTGTALLCLELCGQHASDAAKGAGDYLLKHMPGKFGQHYYYYGSYYAAQGMFQLGGDYWTQWAERMYELMLKFQKKDGSWPVGGGAEARGGPCYATAMAVLAMSVSYRQLPIYQR
jgi:prenyltransferase beta subunit